MDPLLETIWRRCRYHVVLPSGSSLELTVDARAPALDAALDATLVPVDPALPSPRSVDTWAYLTAHNPGAMRASKEENAAATRALDEELLRRGLAAWPGDGGLDPEGDGSWLPEKSRLVPGISLGEAHALARRFGQLAFLFGVRGAPVALVPVTSMAEDLSPRPPLDTVAWVRIDDDARVLMARPRGMPLFFMPGGKKEPGETDLHALARELKEELDVELGRASVQALFVVEAPAWGRTDTVVRMACFAADVSGAPVPAAEIEELAWLGPDEGARMPPAGRLVVQRVSARAGRPGD